MECQCWDKQFYKVSNMCNEEASCCTSLFHFDLHKIHLILEMLKSNLYTCDACEVWRCEVENSSCEAKNNYIIHKFLNYILLYMLTRSQDCRSIWLAFAHGNSMSCLQKPGWFSPCYENKLWTWQLFYPLHFTLATTCSRQCLHCSRDSVFWQLLFLMGENLLRFANFRGVQWKCFLKIIPF